MFSENLGRPFWQSWLSSNVWLLRFLVFLVQFLAMMCTSGPITSVFNNQKCPEQNASVQSNGETGHFRTLSSRQMMWSSVTSRSMKLVFPRQFLQDYRMPFEFYKYASIVPEIRLGLRIAPTTRSRYNQTPPGRELSPNQI